MAISLRGTAKNNAANAGNVTITMPGGVAQNDVVWVIAVCGDNDGVPTVTRVTTGYTDLSTQGRDGSSFDVGSMVSRKVQGATPDSTYEFSSNGGTDSGNAGCLIVLTGVDTATPEDATTTTLTAANTNANPPSISTVTDNAWVIALGGSGANNNAVYSAGPSGYSNFITDVGLDTTDGIAGLATFVKTSFGAEDPGAFNGANDATGASAGYSVAARPASGAAPTSLLFVSQTQSPAMLAGAMVR